MILYKRGGCFGCGGGILKHQNPANTIAGRKNTIVKEEELPGYRKEYSYTPGEGGVVRVQQSVEKPGFSEPAEMPGEFSTWFQEQLKAGREGETVIYPPTGEAVKIELAPQTQTTESSYRWREMQPRKTLSQGVGAVNPNINPTYPPREGTDWSQLSTPIYAGVKSQEGPQEFARSLNMLSGPLKTKYTTPQVQAFNSVYYGALNRGVSPDEALKLGQQAAKEARSSVETPWGNRVVPVKFFIHPDKAKEWKTFNETFNEMFNVNRPNKESSSFRYQKPQSNKE